MENQVITLDQVSIRTYFEKVRELHKQGDKFPVDLDEVWQLVYTRRDTAVRELKNSFIEGEDFNLLQNAEVLKIKDLKNGVKTDYKLSVPAMEFFIAKKVKEVFNVYREVFHQSLDLIYTPQTITRKELALIVIQQEEENERLKLENETKQKQIEKLQPRSNFVDLVFQADELITGSQVCKVLKLGFGNKTLYKKLREMGVFYKNKNEPIQKFVDKDYIQLKEIYINEKIKMQPVFTQKGLGYIAKIFNKIDPPQNGMMKFA